MLIGISTSGNSLNVINAIKKAKEREIFTVGFTGKKGDLDMICLNFKFVNPGSITM